MLDLQKLSNMKVVGIKEAWLLEEIDKASIFEKVIYEKILKNTFEVEYPTMNALKAKALITEGYDFKGLHSRLENKLIEICGKTQFRLSIKGSNTKYSILPNVKDLEKVIKKACKNYNLTDMKKIELCLMNHLSKLDFPILQYYIYKGDSSQLATDYMEYNDDYINVNDKEINDNKPINPNDIF